MHLQRLTCCQKVTVHRGFLSASPGPNGKLTKRKRLSRKLSSIRKPKKNISIVYENRNTSRNMPCIWQFDSLSAICFAREMKTVLNEVLKQRSMHEFPAEKNNVHWETVESMFYSCVLYLYIYLVLSHTLFASSRFCSCDRCVCDRNYGAGRGRRFERTSDVLSEHIQQFLQHQRNDWRHHDPKDSDVKHDVTVQPHCYCRWHGTN